MVQTIHDEGEYMMSDHEDFRDTSGSRCLWDLDQRRGFDDAYQGDGYQPPVRGPDTQAYTGYQRESPRQRQHERRREQYDMGFTDGGYSVLEEAYPGISEATALMHTEGRSSPEDIIHWLLAHIEEKYRWDRSGHLEGYELDGRTVYG